MTTDDGLKNEARTHFGYREVATAEKPKLVQGVFSSVASRYDVMNDLMSAGLHRVWKEALLDWLKPRAGARYLDLAGGTGDVTFRYMRRVKGEADAIVCDYTPAMLAEGQRRAESERFAERVSWVGGDAMALPFVDKSFDQATMAFGIRNVAEPAKALAEIHRVLRPGGRFICLEFSRVEPALARRMYDAYSFAVIPRLGQFVANDRDSYQYLIESIRRFPPQETFAAMMRQAGFARVAYRNMTLGTVAMHSGWRL